MDTQLCRICNNFEKRLLTAWINVRQKRMAFDCTPRELLNASQTCEYCRMLCRGLEQFRERIGEDMRTVVSRIYVRGPTDGGPHTLTLEVYFVDVRPKLEVEFVALGEDGDAAKGTIRSAKVLFNPREPLSKNGIGWVQSRIDDCVANHSKCAGAVETALPTRLLRLDKTAEGTCVVHLEDTKGDVGKYACLSHQWGSVEAAKTTRENYESMLGGVPWEEIPQTFQDAIKFTLDLGIKYLWIDAYCIIQDDQSDWDAESKKMAQVFQNAYITIAATAARNNDTGCFWASEDGYSHVIKDLNEKLTLSSSISVREKMHHWERIWTSNREARFPLLTRAWGFQERILPPRILHFSDRELVWECTELGDCQCGGFDRRSNAKSSSWRLDNSWRNAVELYTSLKLTYKKDRLPALHGFAEFYAPIIAANMQTEYLSGLWKDSVLLDMLWRVEALQIGNDDNTRLCLCWDSEIVRGDEKKNGRNPHLPLPATRDYRPGTLTSDDDSDNHPAKNGLISTRLCQYSYAAACSAMCLDSRHLCRWGTEKAGVKILDQIEGPRCCADNNEEEKTILRFFQYERAHGCIYVEHKANFEDTPTWSWATPHQAVKFWNDIAPVSRSYAIQDSTCVVHEANATSLTLSAKCIPVILWYEHIPDPKELENTVKRSEHEKDPLAEQQRGTLNSQQPINTFHDILRYNMRIPSPSNPPVDFPFHADAILSLEGPRFVPNRSQVFLIHIMRNVYLVVKERWFFALSYDERLKQRRRTSKDVMKMFKRDSDAWKIVTENDPETWARMQEAEAADSAESVSKADKAETTSGTEDPDLENAVEFVRIGILRVPSGPEHSLYSKDSEPSTIRLV